MTLKEILYKNKIMIYLSVIIFLLVCIINLIDPTAFVRFLGNANPLLMFIIVPIFGILLLNIIKLDSQFAVYTKISKQRFFRITLIAVGLAFVPILLVDIIVPFSKDINILFPLSLLFYPAIGFFVDMLFHAIPLLILLLIITRFIKNVNPNILIWIVILIVASLEPFYQAKFMIADGYFPLYTIMIVSLNIFVFNIFQLSLFKKYGFVAMYSFRLIYYLVWHIIWGYFRLNLLF